MKHIFIILNVLFLLPSTALSAESDCFNETSGAARALVVLSIATDFKLSIRDMSFKVAWYAVRPETRQTTRIDSKCVFVKIAVDFSGSFYAGW